MAKGKFTYWLTPDGLVLLEGWARNGLTDEQIAHNCGITATTLYDWKKRFPQISEALKRGKEVIDIQVENALLKRALGYEYMEERVEISEKDGRKVTQTVKTVVPDTAAQIFWLKNRKPGDWRDKRDDGSGREMETGIAYLPPVRRAEGSGVCEDDLAATGEAGGVHGAGRV